MILTPIELDRLPRILDTFACGLAEYPSARTVFGRIAGTQRFCEGPGANPYGGREKAVRLAGRLAIPTRDQEPSAAFSWDGYAIRVRSETSVVFHEIAHWQIAPPARRLRYDFGLGAGPETGRIAEADAAICVDRATKEDEENLASLLGILWETASDQPAVLAFAEQNWLELYDRGYTRRHFADYLEKLCLRGLIDSAGRPVATAAQ
ncbi:MAG: hypothetical protein EXQ84_03080 [Rhodospirillaceae bacterium]|nr:hypothetical protein [Rhodospirillaceae bacterium]